MRLRVLFLLAIIPIFAMAQDPQSGGTPAPADIPAYLPGSEEAGPTLDSRRGVGTFRSQGNLVRLTPFIGVMGVVDTGLAPIVTDSTGQITRGTGYGGMLNFGIAGTRPFRQSTLTIAYRGNVQHFPNRRFVTGVNQFGTLGFNHLFSRKLSFSSNNTLGYVINPFMGGVGAFGVQLGNQVDVENEVFNNPALITNTMQQISYQKSARLSFSAGGGAFMQNRRSDALVNVYGPMVTGTVAYRASRRQTLGANYRYSQFFFDKAYGGTNLHQVGLEWAYQFSSRSEVSANAGIARIESQSLQRVALDPILARLLGVPSGIEAVYRKNYLPTYGAGYRWSGRDWSFNARASRGVGAGNGIVLTNVVTNAGAGITYTGGRRWSAGISGGYSKMEALKGTTRQFESVNGGANFSVRLASGLSWQSTFNARKFSLGQQANGNPFFDRVQYRVQTGLTWHPGDFPLPIF